MFQPSGSKEEESQGFAPFAEISKSDENACTQDPLVIPSDEELSSFASCSLDLPIADYFLESESSDLASDISQDEVSDFMKKNNQDFAFCLEARTFREENADFENHFPKCKFILSKSDADPISNESGYGYDWKESFKKQRLILQRNSFQELSTIGATPPESIISYQAKRDHLTDLEGAEGGTEETFQLNTGIQVTPDDQILNCDAGILAIMQEPLLDCIVRESANKEISTFLTKSSDSLISEPIENKIKFADFVTSSTDKDRIDKMDQEHFVQEQEVGSGTRGKIVNAIGEMENMNSQEYLDKHITVIKSLIQSSKEIKEQVRNNLFQHDIKADFNSGFCPAKSIEVNYSEAHGNFPAPEQQNIVVISHQKMHSEDRGNKGIVPARSNSVLSIQVANLQEDIEKLKEANHCLSAYETILNMYQTKNAQLANEKLQLKQTTIELNETIKMLEQDKKRQQTQIMDLQYNNISLMTRIESEATGDALKRELDELRKDYSLLQEKQKAEEDERIKIMNQCLEMDYTISKKEEEIEELQHINTKLENEMKSSMMEIQRLREKEESEEKQLQVLQEELRQETDIRVAEKEQFESKYAWLLSEVKMFKANFENEHAETENLKQHMNVVMKENLLLHQQATVMKDLNTRMLAENGSWKQQFHKVMQTHGEKEQVHNETVLTLRSEVASLRDALKKKDEEMQWKMHMLGRFLLDMRSMHSDLSMRVPPYEADCFNSTCVQRATQLLSKINNLLSLTEGILVCQDSDSCLSNEHSDENSKNERIIELKEKIKDLNNKKENLAKELQERRLNLSTLRDFANEKASSEEVTKVMDSAFIDKGASQLDLLTETLEKYIKEKEYDQKMIQELEGIVGLKLEECTKLEGDNDNLQRDMNNLICKVVSFEEIVQCANQRLEMYRSQISQLEKRNQSLEEVIKKYRKKYRQQRQKIMEKELTSMSLVQTDECQVDNPTQDASKVTESHEI
ncbi:cancer-associated gene 1 protein [Lissotriton helveticus]